MRGKYWFVSGIIIVLGVVLVSGCVQQTSPTMQLAPCNWVFKTKGNYSNLISVVLNEAKNGLSGYPGFEKMKSLNGGYYTVRWGCFDKESATRYSERIAYTSITWDQWNFNEEDCSKQMLDKTNQLRVKKCGSLNFDVFEECNNFSSPGNITCSISTSLSTTNPTKCAYNISLDENIWRSRCEPAISSTDLFRNIIDTDPFTELYLCKDTLISPGSSIQSTLNLIIDNNELNTKCEKVI